MAIGRDELQLVSLTLILYGACILACSLLVASEGTASIELLIVALVVGLILLVPGLMIWTKNQYVDTDEHGSIIPVPGLSEIFTRLFLASTLFILLNILLFPLTSLLAGSIIRVVLVIGALIIIFLYAFKNVY
ncbi:MAG: hypothetical protein A4E32_02125 [Methanomassiliicoccales archaeon PtaU1.Bin124]|nr:MAG: hypothetical protein A4E32_02125 [Methanomassiliicoccales archaeon PtaU1.Bin124]